MKSESGFSLTELMMVMAIIAILTLGVIAVNPYVRVPAYNEAAETMGVNCQHVEGIYFTRDGTYATHLSQMLAIDKNLLDTPEVTFAWIGTPNKSGYTFQVRHMRGDRWFMYKRSP